MLLKINATNFLGQESTSPESSSKLLSIFHWPELCHMPFPKPSINQVYPIIRSVEEGLPNPRVHYSDPIFHFTGKGTPFSSPHPHLLLNKDILWANATYEFIDSKKVFRPTYEGWSCKRVGEDGLTLLLWRHSLGTIYIPWGLLDGLGAERCDYSQVSHLLTSGAH